MPQYGGRGALRSAGGRRPPDPASRENMPPPSLVVSPEVDLPAVKGGSPQMSPSPPLLQEGGIGKDKGPLLRGVDSGVGLDASMRSLISGPVDASMSSIPSQISGPRSDGELTGSDVASLDEGGAQCLAALKPRPGKEGKEIPLRTNVVEFGFKPGTILYRYNVRVIQSRLLTNGKLVEKDLTKGAADDYAKEEKRNQCAYAMDAVVGEYGDIFKKAFAYDRRTAFFSTRQLPFPNGRDVYIFEEVPGKEEGEQYQVRFDRAEPFEVDLNDFEGIVCEELELRDRSLIQVLEILTNRLVYYGKKKPGVEPVQYGRSIVNVHYDPRQCTQLGNGQYLAAGVNKHVEEMEGSRGEGTPSLVVDMKKVALYKPQGVVDTLGETLFTPPRGPLGRYDGRRLDKPLRPQEIRAFEQNIRGVRVEVTVGSSRSFTVYGVGGEPANRQTLDVEDRGGRRRRVTVAGYWEAKYGVRLRYPHLPCLKQRRPSREEGGGSPFSYFPPEFCRVLPHQRVPITKMNANSTSAIIKECAVTPSERAEETDKLEQDLVRSRQALLGLGALCSGEKLKVKGRVLPKPVVEYDQKRKARIADNGDWDARGMKWFEAAECRKWGVLNMTGNMGNAEELEEFVRLFADKARQFGMKLGTPEMANSTVDGLESNFKYGLDFILFIMPGKDERVKNLIKYLEYQYRVITQCVVLRPVVVKCLDRRGGDLVLTNILKKTNMKLGGINYVLDLKGDELAGKYFQAGHMFLGADVCHPPPQPADERRRGIPPREPSVVGFCSTSGRSPFLPYGNIAFQDPRNENITQLDELVLDALERYTEGFARPLPHTVFYYRDGLSEGQMNTKVLQLELPQIRRAFKEAGERCGQPDYSPRLAIVVVVKRHNLRFYAEHLNPRGNSRQQDFPTGTVVDKGVVPTGDWVFYLKSHAAIQGTAKATKYRVLLNEPGLDADEMERVTDLLCYLHQIVGKPVSIPAPVYSADDLAMRGKRIFRAWSGEDNSSSGVSSDDLSRPDWEKLTSEFRLGKIFRDRKFWA